jgi:hypothetical protein
MIRLVTLLVTLSTLAAQARVEETVAECETRYGPVVEHKPAKQKESDPEACVFSKNGVTILAEFHNGKAWKISYSKVGMEPEHLQALLDAEAANGGWSTPLKFFGQEFRTSGDRERVAVYTPGKRLESMSTLIVATKSFATANRNAYEVKLAKVPDVLQHRMDNKAMKPF